MLIEFTDEELKEMRIALHKQIISQKPVNIHRAINLLRSWTS